jgi:hypothetical protein
MLLIFYLPCFLLTDCKSGNKEKGDEANPGYSEATPIKPTEGIPIHQAALDGAAGSIVRTRDGFLSS